MVACIGLLSINTINAQSQNWWRTTGNTPSLTDYFGTSNNTGLDIRTNNIQRVFIDANGTIKFNNLAGTGSRFIVTDASGNISAIATGSLGSFFSSNGVWNSLPLSATTWNVSGNNINNSNTGNTTINTNFVFGTNGALQNTAWVGTGNRLLQTNANGNLTPFTMGTANQVLYGNGTWGSLPAAINSFSTAGNNVILANGNKLGIGVANPQFPLDVNGDARIGNNLYVGGGIVITDSIKADTIHMGASRVISGTTRVDGDLATSPTRTFTAGGDIIAQSKLTVAGNATFNGNLRSTSLSGAGSSMLSVDAFGNISRGIPLIPAWNCAPNAALPWALGGNSISSLINSLTQGNTMDIGTCDDYDFVLKSGGNQKIWLKSQGGVGFGTASPQAYYHFSGGNLAVDANVGVGTTLPNSKLEVADATNAEVCVNSTSNNSAKMVVKNPLYSYGLSIDGNAQSNSQVNGHIYGIQSQQYLNEAIMTWDGNGNILFGDKNINTQVNTASKLNVNGELNKRAAHFVSNHNSPFAYNTLFSVNHNSAKAIAVENSASGSGLETFVVYGNGYTEIKVQSPNALPTPYGATAGRAFSIRDVAGNRDLFTVTKDGKAYAREVEINLTTTFPDYVFAKDYKLKPLSEVEAFINTNKYLPNFEKGTYYEKNGINVTDLLLKQQQTIEELMLYNIELEKRLKVLEEKK